MTRRTRYIPDEDLKLSLVSPLIAAFISIVPGLGQFFARRWKRGFTIMGSMLTIAGLLVWRFVLAAPRDTGFMPIVKKAIHLEPLLLWICIAIVVLYLWNILDAYMVAKNPRANPSGIMFAILILFFGFGWQIGEVDLVALLSPSENSRDVFGRVLWPWEQAIERPEEFIDASAPIMVPCTDEDPSAPDEIPGEPYIMASPTCGTLSNQDGTSGSTLTLNGRNYAPGVGVAITWEDPIGNEFRQRQGGEYVVVPADENGEFEVDIIMPYRLLPTSAGESAMLWKIHGEQLAAVGAPVPSTELKLAIEKIVETIFIGMMATFFGIILAVPFSFLAAKNLMSASPITLAVYYAARTVMNIVRSIESLVWAIIFVTVVGLGPFAGILALTVHSIAALTKLYSEAIESIDPGPIEAIQATGANWVQTVMFAVIPQIIPPFVSFTIYRWDINIRMSTIIGFVGGGGIGFLLSQWIRLLDYRSAGIAVWFIAITVAILDNVSATIRERFV
ncbi:MAG: phosphonate ABC transporter, permease protein PhnE [Anaerolineales bacterium]|nr:phosphonate ABC transporter, permease protein PhnE [Anaerolineales bacterium]